MPTNVPTEQPTFSIPCEEVSRVEGIGRLIIRLTDDDLLMDAGTSQGRALLWLLNDDPAMIDPCTYPDVVQRYTLVTLYYATEGESWRENESWLSESSECDRFNVTCDTSGAVTDLVLGKSKEKWNNDLQLIAAFSPSAL